MSECARRGELIRCGGAAVDIGQLLAVAPRSGSERRVALAADRWREAELRDALRKAERSARGLSLYVAKATRMGAKTCGRSVAPSPRGA